MKFIDCLTISNSVRSDIKNFVGNLNGQRVPTLAVVVVGNIYASQVYVRNKELACRKCGVNFIKYELKEETTEQELIELLKKINLDPDINAVITQLPLPKHINEEKIKEFISSKKDADCFSPENLAKLFNLTRNDNLDDFILPCTANACIDALKSVCQDLGGKNAVVIGRSNLVGKPLIHLLLKEDCTVIATHSKTVDLKHITQNADIVISAVGKAKFLKGDMFKNDAIAIDVGISRSADNSISGDIDAESLKNTDVTLTPVPGGIGPMTVSYLIKNVCKLFAKQQREDFNGEHFDGK